MEVEIKFDKKKLARVQALLKGIPGALPRVMSRAINKTTLAARTRIVRAIAAEIKVKQKTIRQRISLDRATYTRWQAKLHITGRRIPLIYFGARQMAGGDIRYQINPTGGPTTISYDKESNPVFIGTLKSGHRGVFRRLGKRLPITELFGPSIPAVYEKAPGLAARMLKEAYRDLDKNIDYQLELVFARRRAAG